MFPKLTGAKSRSNQEQAVSGPWAHWWVSRHRAAGDDDEANRLVLWPSSPSGLRVRKYSLPPRLHGAARYAALATRSRRRPAKPQQPQRRRFWLVRSLLWFVRGLQWAEPRAKATREIWPVGQKGG